MQVFSYSKKFSQVYPCGLSQALTGSLFVVQEHRTTHFMQEKNKVKNHVTWFGLEAHNNNPGTRGQQRQTRKLKDSLCCPARPCVKT